MPTEAYFKQHPPFPDGLPLLDIPRLSYTKLSSGVYSESKALWDAGLDHGFLSINIGDMEGGSELLKDIVKVLDIQREYFDLPLEEEKRFPMGTGIGPKPLGAFPLPDGPPDLAELCAISRDCILSPAPSPGTDFPPFFAAHKPFLASLIHRLHPISYTILTHLAQHLEVPMSTMSRLHDLQKPSASILTFNHYPPQTDSAADRQLSLFKHTDSGGISMLFSVFGGLQCLPGNLPDEPQNWRWVKPEPNCLVVNLGDPLRPWSGGLLRSSYHRVWHAPGEQAGCERYTFGYFLKPEFEASMRRIQLGSVIPRLETKEGIREDERIESYARWHAAKQRLQSVGRGPSLRGGTARVKGKEVEVEVK